MLCLCNLDDFKTVKMALDIAKKFMDCNNKTTFPNDQPLKYEMIQGKSFLHFCLLSQLFQNKKGLQGKLWNGIGTNKWLLKINECL